MKKYLFCGIMLIAALNAGAYNVMQFTYSDGNVKTLAISGLTITVNEDNLEITNTAGETLNVSASDLKSMQFVDDPAGVASISIEGMAFEAYNLEGVYLGKFESLLAAKKSLPAGVYVMKNERGETIKIVVK